LSAIFSLKPLQHYHNTVNRYERKSIKLFVTFLSAPCYLKKEFRTNPIIMRTIYLVTFFATITLLSACSTTQPVQHSTLQGTLWVQNAAEYDALGLQAYRQAERVLETALADSSWTASVAQTGKDVSDFPPAVILDIDETVLDNSPFQARMIEQNSSFNPQAWTEWVLEANADPVAGAVEFTRVAAEKGITVFYVSNREAETEEATRSNMQRLGFPLDDGKDTVLLNGEQEDWNSDKINRRDVIEKEYRVLLLFGDDLNDFLPAKNISEEERDQLVESHAENWGKKWFILPNPTYGSWDQALFNFESGLSEEDRQQVIREHLDTRQ
jgi:acid phosphatase